VFGVGQAAAGLRQPTLTAGLTAEYAAAIPPYEVAFVEFAAWGGIHITIAGGDFKEYMKGESPARRAAGQPRRRGDHQWICRADFHACTGRARHLSAVFRVYDQARLQE
jgi:hypothetical protein